MEFDGKIVRVLPAREGTSERTGNAWKTLPFVFEFFTPENQQWPERVLLETFDTNYQAMIAPYCKRGQDGKVALNQYGDVEMIAPMPIHIGFSLKVRNGKRQDGTSFTVNDIRIYKFEAIQPAQQQQAQQPQYQQQPPTGYQPAPAQPQTAAPQYQPQAQQPFPPQNQPGGQANDDLPF